MAEEVSRNIEYGPFADAWKLPDEMWGLIDVDNATTVEELHFLRVLWFHFDFENGGLNQVMFNQKGQITDCISSFREIGLECLADVIQIARKQIAVGSSWQSVFNRTPADIDSVYRAIAYGNPFDNPQRDERFQEFAPPIVDNFYRSTDWVVRTALKYARDNFDKFPFFRSEYGL